jgi:hypothetical protein
LPLDVTIANEQTKLRANALDRASTAFIAGSIVPFLGWIRADEPASAWKSIFGIVCFMGVGAYLHLVAVGVLRGLRE